MTNSSIQALFPHSKMQYQPNMPNLKMGVPMVAAASTSKGKIRFHLKTIQNIPSYPHISTEKCMYICMNVLYVATNLRAYTSYNIN
jgi:hypothetical protein